MAKNMSDICIVFGGNSQDGFYLGDLCRKKGMKVISVSRGAGDVLGDVSVYQFVEGLIKKYMPTYVFHLAANSTTKHDAILENYQTICIGTCNILEAIKSFSPETRVYITGSGLQFKNNGLPISERDPFVFDSAYAVVRNSSVECARYYRSLGLHVYVGYLFHHESPMRKPNHVSKMIALAARRIANGSCEKLEIGDISVKKEWAFAGDIANGMLMLVSQDEIFEAVIGTGEGHTIEDWLNTCFSSANLDWKQHVMTRNGFVAEYSMLISDPGTMFNLGWRPSTSFESLALLMMHTQN